MDNLEAEIDRLRLRCIGCGKCSRACPSLRHGGCDPMEIMIGTEENLESCIACGNCSKVCHRTDPFTVMRDLLSIRKGIHVSDAFRQTGYAMPLSGMEVPEPRWTGDDAYVMPGCVVKCRVPFMEYAASVAMDAIGVRSRELPGNTCCMHPVQFREMIEADRRRVKLDMGDRADGRTIVTLCGGCSEELQAASVDAVHIIGFLHGRIDSLPRFGKPLKVALQPGCSAMDLKKETRAVVEAMGCTPIGNTMGCCGKNVDVSVPLMAEREAECAGADVIVVGCPMCFVKYDSQEGGIPVVHIAELVAMAAGDRTSLGFHRIPVPE